MTADTATPRVLLVEDNEDDAELARRAFRRCAPSTELTCASDGVQALELLLDRGHPILPDLILLDLKLPRVDGFDVLARLRAAPATALLPIVVLTTSLERRDLLEAYRRGANSYLRKPVHYEEFAEMVALVVRYWLHLNQSPPAEED
jgi:two-component system response regulator